MKKVIIISATAIAILSGCTKQEIPGDINRETTSMTIIDSTGLVEDINNPGVMLTTYDTLTLFIDTDFKYSTQEGKTSYRVVDK